MKWKKQIWVFDDIISIAQQEEVKNTVMGMDFPWFFVPDITGGHSRDKRPGFSHNFIRAGVINTNTTEAHIKMLEMLVGPCMEKIKEKTASVGNYSVFSSRTFLQLPLSTIKGGEYDAPHVDLFDEHFALLYYVCDSDGDTVIFENMYSKEKPKRKPPLLRKLKEKIRVTPKQGRVVIFDGFYWHTATQPSKNVRCVINTDVVQAW
jgi:hypothetical protein